MSFMRDNARMNVHENIKNLRDARPIYSTR